MMQGIHYTRSTAYAIRDVPTEEWKKLHCFEFECEFEWQNRCPQRGDSAPLVHSSMKTSALAIVNLELLKWKPFRERCKTTICQEEMFNTELLIQEDCCVSSCKFNFLKQLISQKIGAKQLRSRQRRYIGERLLPVCEPLLLLVAPSKLLH